MLSDSTTAPTARPIASPVRGAKRWWRTAGQTILRYPLGSFGAAILVLAGIGAAFASVLAPYDPNMSISGARLVGPSASHWFGTDNLARDLLSRILFGLRTSLTIAGGATLLAVVFGTTIGAISGYMSSFGDNIIQRCLDVVMAFPGLVLALMLAAVFGPSIQNIIFAVAVGQVPWVARVVRGSVLAVKEEDYVLSAKAIGASSIRVALRHILPNTLGPLIVMASIVFGVAILVGAALSFLGVGVQPPTADLGGMLSGESRTYMLVAWWMAVFPGLALSALVFGVNLLGDSLRDALDPRVTSGPQG